MANITPAYVTVNPSYIMPEAIVQQQQVSGAFSALATGSPLVRLSTADQYVYMKRIDIRTKAIAAQAAQNQLPSCSVTAQMISTPTYLLRTRAEYDHHDTAAAASWGFALPEAQRLGMRQAIFQTMRGALLYGMNPANGEGLLNTNGATLVNLPNDMNGNDTVLTYDNGAMYLFLLAQIAAAKTRMMLLGQGLKIVIVGPQRVLGSWEYQGIVQLTQFQRPGAGTESITGAVGAVAGENGDTIQWEFDDTLIGKGQGGTDAVLMIIPELVAQPGTQINTNEFAKLTPNTSANTLMLVDMAAPREIPSPMPGGAIDVVQELRSTSGWGARPEGVTILSMAYSE